MPDALSNTPNKPSPIRAWLQLLRAPNLFTVPGDPAAGFFLVIACGLQADRVRLLPACLCSLLLYCAGLIQNDLRDLGEDRRDRPNRPLPSGAVGVRAARGAFLVCAAVALGAAWAAGAATLATAAALLAAVTVYNCLLKPLSIVGPLAMGACRGLSLLVGATAGGAWAGVLQAPVLISAGGLTLYIAAVTSIASRETSEAPISRALAALPCLALVAWFGALYGVAAWRHQVIPAEAAPAPWSADWLPLVLSGLFAATAVAWALHCAMLLRARQGATAVAQVVGALIRGLIRVQAALVLLVLWEGAWAAVALMAAWYAAGALGRRFYAS